MKQIHNLLDQGKQFGTFLLRYTLFWLLFFLLCRVFFVTYHLSRFMPLSAATDFGILIHGFRMDLSAAGYLAIIPFLVRFIHTLRPNRFSKGMITGYTLFMLLGVALIATFDLQLYQVWGTKLNAQAFRYLKFPKEAMASMSSSPVALLLILCVVLFLAGFFLYRAMFRRLSFTVSSPTPSLLFSRLLGFSLLSGLLFVAIRGGVGLAPMNPSFAYFSSDQFANHTALNTSWNLICDLKNQYRNKGNSFVYMSDPEMHERVERLSARRAPVETEWILTTAKPNIVIIIMESWTADVIASLGGAKGVTPSFEALASQGILFTNFYANGWRTSYGIAAVLGGFPSTPEGSILNRPNKMEHLPTLAGSLKANGYATSVYYGGDPHFDDMIAFFHHSKFDKITSKASFEAKDMNSKWGVHDHVLFERVLSDLEKQPEPFFAAMLTISSHEPFEVPMKTVFSGNDQPSLFKNAIYYTDQSLKSFIDQARTKPWFKNTLFLFVADHGSGLLTKEKTAYTLERYQIPLLLYGEVIKNDLRGKKIGCTGSQSDIAATLLAQLQIRHDDFLWSNDLLNKNRGDFAFYNFAGGFGMKTPSQLAIFDTVSKKIIHEEGKAPDGAGSDGALKDGEAYLQFLYQKYSGF